MKKQIHKEKTVPVHINRLVHELAKVYCGQNGLKLGAWASILIRKSIDEADIEERSKPTLEEVERVALIKKQYNEANLKLALLKATEKLQGEKE